MGETKFSIIVPAYNVAPFIEECIQSALGQSCQDFEIIVVDDRSTDGTSSIVRRFTDDRVQLIVNPENRGVSYSRNAGITRASGEYIVILDSDDVMAPNRLETFSRYLEQEQPDLIFDDLLYFRDGEPASGVTAYSKRGITASDVDGLGYSHFIKQDLGILQGAIRKAFLAEHSIMYAEGHDLGEDFVFYSEVFLNGGKVTFIPDALYLYRQRDLSLATSISPRYYEGFIATTRLVLSKYERVLHASPHRSLLMARLRHQTAALGYYKATTKIKSRDYVGALSYLLRDPRIGITLARRIMRKLTA